MSEYIAQDEVSKEILNSAKLLQNIDVHALILGEKSVGKKSLAKYILPKAKIYDARELQESISLNLIDIIDDELIIKNIDQITNIPMFVNWIQNSHIRVIATSNKLFFNEKLKDIFSISLELPSLDKRPKDTKSLCRLFSKEISKTLDVPLLKEEDFFIDIQNNTKSLKKSIYFSYLFEELSSQNIKIFLEKYFFKTLDEQSNYKELLKIFEVPLLKVSEKKFKSQVKMSEKLGLNRITLRKKLALYKEEL